MKLKLVAIVLAGLFGTAAADDRYEAENAIVDQNSVLKVADSSASGGYYVNMEGGNLSFNVTVAAAGFYTLWISYSEPYDTNGKIQNLSINGESTGQLSFPYQTSFVYIKASPKIKLAAGANAIGIVNSWGWVNIDYIEISPYVATPFSISNTLVTPNASDNAKKMYRVSPAEFSEESGKRRHDEHRHAERRQIHSRHRAKPDRSVLDRFGQRESPRSPRP